MIVNFHGVQIFVDFMGFLILKSLLSFVYTVFAILLVVLASKTTKIYLSKITTCMVNVELVIAIQLRNLQPSENNHNTLFTVYILYNHNAISGYCSGQ